MSSFNLNNAIMGINIVPKDETEAVRIASNGAIGIGIDSNLLHKELAHSAGNLNQAGDAQHRSFILRGHSTYNNPVFLSLNGNNDPQYLTIPNNASWNFSIKIIARKTYFDIVKTAAFNFVGALENSVNGCSLLHNTKTVLYNNGVNWESSLAVNSSNNQYKLDIICSNDNSDCSGEYSCSGSYACCDDGVYWVATVDIAQIIVSN